LVTAIEHPDTEAAIERLGDAIERHVDVSALLDAARKASRPLARTVPERRADGAQSSAVVRIGVLRDRAFSFYYPENLTALEDAGAEIVTLSPIDDDELPDIDALYAGGGFPEVYARELSENYGFRGHLAARIAEGLPVWAECGGITYLAEALTHAGRSYPMVGALPVAVEHTERPRGHGYVEARVDAANPFFDEGTELRGHEFHYSHVTTDVTTVNTILDVQRGVGLGGKRDGLINGSVVATYTHLHALGTPHWAERVVQAARSGMTNDRGRTRRTRALPVVQKAPRRATPKPVPSASGGSSTLRQRAEQRAVERSKVAAALGRRRRTRGGGAGLRARVRAAVEGERLEELRGLVAEDSRSIRFLLALTYETDPTVRRVAARGIALASHYHPRLVQNVIRRLVWAMNDESGTNALTAPEALQAIADERAELLVPMVPDLVRLAADDGLREGLSTMLRTVASRCPGEIGRGLSQSLSKRAKDGGCCGI
jgi:CobQ-like glutamine amidotransferase family enzyme